MFTNSHTAVLRNLDGLLEWLQMFSIEIKLPNLKTDLTTGRILISRADAIGDVVLTLPVAKVLREHYPQATIGFLAKRYTHPVLEACPFVDKIVDADIVCSKDAAHAENDWGAIIHVFPQPQIARWAKRVSIPIRIGTKNRLYHWWTCNRRVPLSRKRSDLHEAQLNLKLLEALGIKQDFPLETLRKLRPLEPAVPIPTWLRSGLCATASNIILHPTSMGSAREWGLENFEVLAKLLITRGYAVFITGTEKDGVVLQPFLNRLGNSVTNLIGRLSLAELIAFIAWCDGLVASSTGPLHLAAALGRATVGLYPVEQPMHPGRWAPIGPFADWLTANPVSSKKENVLEGISPEDVFHALQQQLSFKWEANHPSS